MERRCAECDVAGDVEMREERVVLEDHVDRALVGRVRGDIPTAELDPTAGRGLEAADHAQGRRLAAARRAEQREELARLDLERHLIDGHDLAESLLEVDQPDLGEGRVRPVHEGPRLCAGPGTRGSPSHAPQRCQTGGVDDAQVLLPVRTKRLLLRPYADSDLDALHDIHRREDVTRYLPWGPRSIEDVRGMIERRVPLTTLNRSGDGLLLVLVVAPDGPLIGDVDLQLLSREHRQGEIGYVLHPAHQGHGYATEAAEALLRIGFETYDLHRIIGKVDGRNEASGRVLERIGMRREAVFRENEFFKGEWVDEVVYAILADEWRARR